jgi:hypothetical protein
VSYRTIRVLMEAVAPITHMSGTEGNEAVLQREEVATDRGTIAVPFLSGNALRHRAVRDPGVRWLIDAYGLRGKLTTMQLNFLLHGGNLTGSTAHESMHVAGDLKRLWPLVKLIGGTLPNQIVPGRLDVWRGSLVCRENAALLPEVSGTGLRSCIDLVGGYQYTRGDAKGSGIETQEGILEDPSNLMIFAGQAVLRGALFIGGFVIRSADIVDLGALLWSLREWQRSGCTIGGQGARGHGRLRLQLVDFDDELQEEACQAYVSHAMQHAEEAVDFLRKAVA